jgi:hypothetical protein
MDASFLEEVVSRLCRVEDDNRLGEEGHMDHVPCRMIVKRWFVLKKCTAADKD